jgi:hypothetical protein
VFRSGRAADGSMEKGCASDYRKASLAKQGDLIARTDPSVLSELAHLVMELGHLRFIKAVP